MTTLDLPVPPSVNRTRAVNWSAVKKVKAWAAVADAHVMQQRASKHHPLRFAKFERFALTITLSEQHTRIDLDNGIKVLIDYLRRIELIADDAQKNMRRLVVEWGEAPLGARITVTPLSDA